MHPIASGLAAGAAGTTALNAVTYADMAIRGRPESELPKQAVSTLLERAGTGLPGDDRTRAHRLEALGAASGIAAGLGIGVVCAFGRRLLRRMPTSLAAVTVGGLAMAATDVPMAQLGLTDPRTWSPADWLADAVPHLAYGFVTARTLKRLP